MRLINGLSAFATIAAVVGICSIPGAASEPLLFYVWLLIFWHTVWFSATKPALNFSARSVQALVVLIVCFPAAMILNGLFHYGGFPVTSPMLCILAIGELAYCIRAIILSLPQSLSVGSRRKAVMPSPVPASLSASPTSVVGLQEKQD